MQQINRLLGTWLALGMLLPLSTATAADGKKVTETFCASCHSIGLLGAPKLGSASDWKPRLDKGISKVYSNAINGVNSMPARGGNPKLTDADMKAAVDYMISLNNKSSKSASKSAKKKSAPKKVVKKVIKKANTFNRLMKPASERNPPPALDGIHDPENEGTHLLLAPRDSFSSLAKANSGNRVDWVKSLNEGSIDPRYDRDNPDAKPVVMDLNIVREVKGSMPDVVYPHKQHTEWLDCSNCHPDIFIPQKGANSISMAAILLGQKCGVCHGKVAFPVSECRKCHSKNKPKKKKVAKKK
jgi:c(7)-type cytochrome triheme protein